MEEEFHSKFTAYCMDAIQYEVPFYDYKDYEENYDRELKLFLDNYPSSTESNYKDKIEKLYKSWINLNQTLLDYTIIEQQNTYGGYTEKRIGFIQLANIVDSYFRKYSTNNRSEFSKEIFEDILDKAEEDRKIEIPPSNSLEFECKKYYLYKKYHLKFYRFLYLDESGKVVFDTNKYDDFGYAIKRIFNDIRTEKNIEQETEEIVYEDFDISIKQKLIILHKLGVIDYIKSIQITPENVTHTAGILASILNGKPATIKSYLNPMLTETEDNTSVNNPYNVAENKVEANKVIDKLKIDTSKIK